MNAWEYDGFNRWYQRFRRIYAESSSMRNKVEQVNSATGRKMKNISKIPKNKMNYNDFIQRYNTILNQQGTLLRTLSPFSSRVQAQYPAIVNTVNRLKQKIRNDVYAYSKTMTEYYKLKYIDRYVREIGSKIPGNIAKLSNIPNLTRNVVPNNSVFGELITNGGERIHNRYHLWFGILPANVYIYRGQSSRDYKIKYRGKNRKLQVNGLYAGAYTNILQYARTGLPATGVVCKYLAKRPLKLFLMLPENISYLITLLDLHKGSRILKDLFKYTYGVKASYHLYNNRTNRTNENMNMKNNGISTPYYDLRANPYTTARNMLNTFTIRRRDGRIIQTIGAANAINSRGLRNAAGNPIVGPLLNQPLRKGMRYAQSYQADKLLVSLLASILPDFGFDGYVQPHWDSQIQNANSAVIGNAIKRLGGHNLFHSEMVIFNSKHVLKRIKCVDTYRAPDPFRVHGNMGFDPNTLKRLLNNNSQPNVNNRNA